MAKKYQLSYTAKQIDEILGKSDSVVLATDQSLTPEQKSQVQENIGAKPIICNASGSIISVKDASNRHMRSFVVYGKTYDDGYSNYLNVGDNGSIIVTVAGKNLFGGEALADKLVEFGAVKDETAGTVRIHRNSISGQILFEGPFKENTQYTIILYGKGETSRNVNICFWYADGYKNFQFSTTVDESGLSYAVYTSDAGKTLKNISGISYGGSYVVLHYNKCGLFEGKVTKEDFEPYVGYYVTVPTPNNLRGIPVDSGGNYTDESGQQWVCDEIDLISGEYTQRIAFVDLGELDWVKYDGAEYIYTVKLDKKPASLILSSGYTVYEQPTTLDTFIEEAQIRTIGSSVNDGTIFLCDTPESMAANCLSGLPLYYELAEPNRSFIPAEDLEAYKTLRTLKPYTNIFNDIGADMDAGADMAVEYVADKKTYIDNKIAALAAVIVNNT